MNDFSYSFDVQDNFITIIIIFIFALVMFSNTKIFIRLMPDTLQDENCPLTFVWEHRKNIMSTIKCSLSVSFKQSMFFIIQK